MTLLCMYLLCYRLVNVQTEETPGHITEARWAWTRALPETNNAVIGMHILTSPGISLQLS